MHRKEDGTTGTNLVLMWIIDPTTTQAKNKWDIIITALILSIKWLIIEILFELSFSE